MRPMISLIVVTCLALQPAALLAQGAPDARIYLADGTVVMGQLLNRDDDLLILRSGDGEIHTFDVAEVAKVVTLDSLGSQARVVQVREFPYISFLGGTVALGLISWLQFDTASARDEEAQINRNNDSNLEDQAGLLARAQDLEDKADRARLWGWSSGVLAAGCLGVALIPRTKTRKVFPTLSLDAAGRPAVQLVYRHAF
ncbi:MAG: hypothetical protein OXG13_04215 [Gemmatimonadaceae bacterium]|nr:hypothetical protein [Gemmatimonadaceae bacterium]